MADKMDVANLTLTQEAELNAKAASVESFEQKMAFETYYKLGENRSFAKAAAQVGRSTRTIERWASDSRWQPRVRERERQAAEFLLMQKSAEEEANVKAKHLTLLDASISTWSKKLLENAIKINSVEDLDKLIRLRWEIANMANKKVNPSGINMGSGGMIDLRLRNMDRDELQKFLHGTLASISRIMDKKPLRGPQDGTSPAQSSGKINMDLTVNLGEASVQDSDPGSDIVDVTPQSPISGDLPDDFGDLDLDIGDIEDI